METPDHSATETPEQRREYWRGRGISLEHQFGWPVSWGLLADEADDLALLGRFVREYHMAYPDPDVERAVEIAGETVPRGASVNRAGVDEAAVRITGRVQVELARLREVHPNDDPKPWLRWELAKARWVAIDALVYWHDNQFAKVVQAESAAPGPALAICVGKGSRIIHTGARTVTFRPQGCYEVFEDAKFGRGDMWPHWCPLHQASKPGRDQERAFVSEEMARSRPR